MKRNKALIVPFALWAAIFIVVPLVMIVWYGVTVEESIPYTEMVQADGSVVFQLEDGSFTALILTGKDFKRPALWLMLLILPMWMNFLLRTYSWMSILENNGILNNWIASLREMFPAFDQWLLDRGVRRRVIFLYNENAVILGMVYNYLSFMIMPIYTVIEKIDKSLLEAAADLGASPAKSFMRVTLPYSLPGVLEGITMVFVPAVTTFVISQLMGGGKVPLIGDIIQNQFGKSSDWHFGATLSLLVMVVVLAFMGALNRIDKDDEPVKEVRIL